MNVGILLLYRYKTCSKREYCEQLYVKILDSLVEMNKLLETQNLPRTNDKEIENLKRTTTSKEIESLMKNIPAIKALGLMMPSPVHSTRRSKKNGYCSSSFPKN